MGTSLLQISVLEYVEKCQDFEEGQEEQITNPPVTKRILNAKGPILKDYMQKGKL